MVWRSFLSKIKNTVSWTHVINDLNGEEIVGTFYEKITEDKSQRLWNKKIIKRKWDKLYIKSKGYDNLFNSWIDKKVILWNESILS